MVRAVELRLDCRSAVTRQPGLAGAGEHAKTAGAIEHADPVAAHFDDVDVAIRCERDAERLLHAVLDDQRGSIRRRSERRDHERQRQGHEAVFPGCHLSRSAADGGPCP
jgi:hypothetical protein